MASISVHYKIAALLLFVLGSLLFVSSRAATSGAGGNTMTNQKLFKEAQTYLAMSVDASDMQSAVSHGHFAAAYMRLVDQTSLDASHNVTDVAQQIQSRNKKLRQGSAQPSAARRGDMLP